MKSILLIIISLFYLSVYAQQNSKGVVYYGHKQSFGMGAPIGNDYNATLIFDTKKATYTFAKDSLEGGHIRKMNMFKNEKQYFMVMKRTTKQGYLYHLNTITGQIMTRDFTYNYVKDFIPKINWNISQETKRIGGFDCIKATCNFRGRDYTAWFSFQIPLPYGPWKLQGLPGLILEAYDTNKEIYFYFKSIEYPSKKELKINIPNPKTNTNVTKSRPTTKREWISIQEYKKVRLKEHKEGIKRGRMFMQSNPYSKPNKVKHSMKNSSIEVFDEK